MMTSKFQAPVVPLFVPGDRPERFAKAASSGADAIILDLEDAVAPTARDTARRAVVNHGIDTLPVIVRVNAAASPDFAADLAVLKDSRFDALMLAKAETADQVLRVHRMIGRMVPVIVLIETAAAFIDLGRLLRAPGVVQAAFGSLDMAVDLGCQPSREALAHTRAELILQSRLAGLAAPLDGVTTTFNDPELVAADACHASALGFGGKLAIHPRQVGVIRDAFVPDAKTIAWAREIVTATQSGAAVQLDGAMIDRPVIERAHRILSRFNVIGATSL